MESLPARRRSCLLRFRENCPFRKLRRQTYDVSAVASSPAGPSWNSLSPPAQQPISIPPPSRFQSVCSPDRSEVDIDMEEDPPAAQNLQNLQNLQQNPESRAEDRMELDDDVDPETGERAQG